MTMIEYSDQINDVAEFTNSVVSMCKVLKWGLFRLPAYVANVTMVFTKFSG